VVLMDAGYGNDTGLRTDITALGVRYVAGIGPNTSVWPPGEAPVPPQSRTGRGRPQTRLQRGQHQPLSVKALALSLPQEAWQTVTWREGSADWLASRFARRRVRPAHRDNLLSEARAEEWLLAEWPEGETEPTKYWFSNLPEDIAFDRLIDLTKAAMADRA
jgi:SRSO17 transposase